MSFESANFDKNIAYMNSFIEKHSCYPSSTENNQCTSWTPPKENVVLVTGTTGNLGSDLLYVLLSDERVSKVYALNRVSYEGSSLERVKMQFEMKGLPTGILESEKVIFIDGKLALPDLGLDPEVLAKLRNEVTTIVHNAWPINLMMGFSHYESSLVGLCNLIGLAKSSANTHTFRFLFISSVSVAAKWSRMKGGEPVPEAILDDPSPCLGNGYAESKFAAEAILARSGLNATSLRFYQLCGRQADGFWNPMEWPPILLKASLKMGIIIDMVGRCAFLQADIAADCIRDVVVSSRVTPPVLNFTHPRPAVWNNITGCVRQLLPEAVEYPTMTVWDFIDELAKRGDSATRAEIKESPGLILAKNSNFKAYAADNKELMARAGKDTDEHFPQATLGIEKALDFCPSLRNAKEFNAESMEKYFKFWVKIGFLDGEVSQGGAAAASA